jgi:hypothetical protein
VCISLAAGYSLMRGAGPLEGFKLAMKGTAVDLALCILFFGGLAVLLAVMYYLERSLEPPVSAAVAQPLDGTHREAALAPVGLAPAAELDVAQLAVTPPTH